MKYTVFFLIVLLSISYTSYTYAQSTNNSEQQNVEWEDVVLLKSGASFRGILLEQIPGKLYRLRLNDGNIIDFEGFLVDMVVRQPKVKVPVTNNSTSTQAPQTQTGNSQKGDIVYSTIIKPSTEQVKPLPYWFEAGPRLNAGFTGLGTAFGLINDGLGLIYGYGAEGSGGILLNDKMYLLGQLSVDFNTITTPFASDSRSDYEYPDIKFNTYRLGLGMSYRMFNYYIFWTVGQSFSERWVPGYTNEFEREIPSSYGTDKYLYINSGTIIHINGKLSGIVGANITGLFDTFMITTRFGLTYSINFPDEEAKK